MEFNLTLIVDMLFKNCNIAHSLCIIWIEGFDISSMGVL